MDVFNWIIGTEDITVPKLYNNLVTDRKWEKSGRQSRFVERLVQIKDQII